MYEYKPIRPLIVMVSIMSTGLKSLYPACAAVTVKMMIDHSWMYKTKNIKDANPSRLVGTDG